MPILWIRKHSIIHQSRLELSRSSSLLVGSCQLVNGSQDQSVKSNWKDMELMLPIPARLGRLRKTVFLTRLNGQRERDDRVCRIKMEAFCSGSISGRFMILINSNDNSLELSVANRSSERLFSDLSSIHTRALRESGQ